MTSQLAEMQAVLEQLDKLEMQNRRLKWSQASLAALVLIGAVFLMGQSTSRSRTIEAERFNLLDSEGRTRAELLMVADGPALKLYDAQRSLRVALSIYQNTPSFGLYDPTGVARIGLTNRLEDGPSLWLGSASGQPQAQLDAIGERPRLYLEDKSGMAASFGDDTVRDFRTGEAESTSAASIVLFGPGRKAIWRAPQ
jgi:hypothetical protein